MAELIEMRHNDDAAFNRWLGSRFLALDELAHAWSYLHAQFRVDLPRIEAQALVDAMGLVTRARFAVLDEAESAAKAKWPEQYAHG